MRGMLAKYMQGQNIKTEHEGLEVEGQVLRIRLDRIGRTHFFEYLIGVSKRNLWFWKKEDKLKSR